MTEVGQLPLAFPLKTGFIKVELKLNCAVHHNFGGEQKFELVLVWGTFKLIQNCLRGKCVNYQFLSRTCLAEFTFFFHLNNQNLNQETFPIYSK